MKKHNPLYIHTEGAHNTRAAEVVVPVLFQYVQPESVLDVGCGIGTWLKVLNEFGVSEFLGVDSKYVDRSMLEIDETNFIEHDLSTSLNLGKHFDLVISLEVAEHLPEHAADIFVKTLIRHGKIILFSAAIPGQGGQNHINEQWPSYWREKFAFHGYEFYDSIRPVVWDNVKVDRWYRQNMFLVIHESIETSFVPFKGDNLIHPAYWKEVENLRVSVDNWEKGRVGIKAALKTFRLALGNRLLNKINKKP